ncbi:hypothetical protein PFISCL1PPCAC_20145, partial [Pristionchus fissidentatus]
SFLISDILRVPYSPSETDDSTVTSSSSSPLLPLSLPPLADFFPAREPLLSVHDGSIDDFAPLPSSPSSLQSSFDSGTGDCGAGESSSDGTGEKENFVSPSRNDERAKSGEERPKLSYNALIMMAIKNSPDGRLCLSGIYDYIISNFSYYRDSSDGNWKNSIRHNLSISKSFVKIPREFGDAGKGCYWAINGDEQLSVNSATGKVSRRRKSSSFHNRPYGIYHPPSF